jgi:hypothetical protein
MNPNAKIESKQDIMEQWLAVVPEKSAIYISKENKELLDSFNNNIDTVMSIQLNLALDSLRFYQMEFPKLTQENKELKERLKQYEN